MIITDILNFKKTGTEIFYIFNSRYTVTKTKMFVFDWNRLETDDKKP